MAMLRSMVDVCRQLGLQMIGAQGEQEELLMFRGKAEEEIGQLSAVPAEGGST